MDEITAKDLIDNFKHALIVDIDKKKIYITKNGTIMIYQGKRYQEILDTLGFEELVK